MCLVFLLPNPVQQQVLHLPQPPPVLQFLVAVAFGLATTQLHVVVRHLGLFVKVQSGGSRQGASTERGTAVAEGTLSVLLGLGLSAIGPQKKLGNKRTTRTSWPDRRRDLRRAALQGKQAIASSQYSTDRGSGKHVLSAKSRATSVYAGECGSRKQPYLAVDAHRAVVLLRRAVPAAIFNYNGLIPAQECPWSQC
jgi:hypothetical protein